VRGAHHAAEIKKRENLPVDAAATDAFIRMVKIMQEGGGVAFTYDLIGEDDGVDALATTLESRVIEDEQWEGDEDEGE
jgi:hypothetical protein